MDFVYNVVEKKLNTMNTTISACVIPGAGAFEIAAYQELMKYKGEVKGRARLGKYLLIYRYYLVRSEF